jgi:phenylalanyl-tRNA synthetase alpha subunit
MEDNLKSSTQDTPVTEVAAETEVEQENVSLDEADTTPVVETEPKEEMVSKADLEEALKEKEQVEKRKNQLEKLLEKATNNPESSKKDEIIAELQEQLTTIKEEDEKTAYEKQVADYTKEMDNLFEKQLEKYPETVQKAARFNKDKFGVLSIVGEAQYAYQAEKNIGSFLEELSDNFGEVKPDIKIDATNPSITPSASEQDLIEAEKAKPEKDRNYQAILAKRLGKRM